MEEDVATMRRRKVIRPTFRLNRKRTEFRKRKEEDKEKKKKGEEEDSQATLHLKSPVKKHEDDDEEEEGSETLTKLFDCIKLLASAQQAWEEAGYISSASYTDA